MKIFAILKNMSYSHGAITPVQIERCAAPSTNERNLIKDAIQFVTRAVQLANDIDIYASANSLRTGKRWWEEKYKRHADLITLICKLSGETLQPNYSHIIR